MSYSTNLVKAVPHSSYQIVFEMNGYSAYLGLGRLFLYRKGYRLAELINGYTSLTKSYKGSFEVWIEKIKEKDMNKIENIKEEIIQLEKICVLFDEIHS